MFFRVICDHMIFDPPDLYHARELYETSAFAKRRELIMSRPRASSVDMSNELIEATEHSFADLDADNPYTQEA